MVAEVAEEDFEKVVKKVVKIYKENTKRNKEVYIFFLINIYKQHI